MHVTSVKVQISFNELSSVSLLTSLLFLGTLSWVKSFLVGVLGVFQVSLSLIHSSLEFFDPDECRMLSWGGFPGAPGIEPRRLSHGPPRNRLKCWDFRLEVGLGKHPGLGSGAWVVLPDGATVCCPPRYLINFLLDATVGMLLIYVGVRAVSVLVEWQQWESLRFGEYGKVAWTLDGGVEGAFGGGRGCALLLAPVSSLGRWIGSFRSWWLYPLVGGLVLGPEHHRPASVRVPHVRCGGAHFTATPWQEPGDPRQGEGPSSGLFH